MVSPRRPSPPPERPVAAFREMEEEALRDPDAFERRILERWRAEDLFGKTLAARADAPPFVFYEGPPTANGRPGIHHVLARTLKDVVCRYRTMRGSRVLRKAGWDTHGLPVEIEIEKKLGLSGKGEIEAFGIGEFNRLCRESVFEHKGEWERLSERIGFWLDYRDPYITCSNEYVESVWYLLSRFHANRLLYRGRKVIPFCPRCGTGLSSHEVGLGYREVSDPSVTVLFPVAGARGRYLAAWTTTPWTLPSNVALAVHPRLRYARVRRADREVIAAKDRLAALFPSGDFETLEEMDGEALVGIAYAPLYPADGIPRLPTGGWEPSGEHAYRVRPAEHVSAAEGTGIVHTAPAYGPDDHALAARDRLPVLAAVGADGRFAAVGPVPSGTFFKEADPLVLADLKARGLLLRRDEVRHAYPFCWRCDTPLFYFATPAWFLRTTAYRDRLIAANRAIRWVPREVGTGRFGDWLEGNVDWAVSRDRYWGTPLPIWSCDRDEAHVEVFGGVAELRGRAGAIPDELDLHRPAVDAISFPCRACGGAMRRVPAVLDCWFDSGAMPFAQWHWPFENRERVREQFPADFIAEGLDQTRGWFYTLHAIATFVTAVDGARSATDPTLTLPEGGAYRACLVNGLVLDREGKKMSKRLGNTVDPWDALGRDGADGVRWYLLATAAPWLPKRFDAAAVSDVRHGFLRKVVDSYNFFARYAAIEGFEAGDAAGGSSEALDRWLESRLQTTAAESVAALDAYDLTAACRHLERFVVEELSNWYIRRSRERFWRGGEAARPAFATLHDALVATARFLAPFAPFLADEVHRRLLGEAESVHLAPFPEGRAERVDARLEATMDLVLRACRMGHTLRERARRRVRQPLRAVRVWAMASSAADLGDEAFARLVRDELNVKELRLASGPPREFRIRAKPDYPTLGKRLGGRIKAVERKLEELNRSDPHSTLWGLKSGGQRLGLELEGGTVEISGDELRFSIESPAGTSVESDGDLVVALETEVTEDLRMEGIAREIVSRVQALRRESGFAVTDRIVVHVREDAPPDVRRALDAHRKAIADDTLADGGIRLGPSERAWTEVDLGEEGGRIGLAVERVARGSAA